MYLLSTHMSAFSTSYHRHDCRRWCKSKIRTYVEYILSLYKCVYESCVWCGGHYVGRETYNSGISKHVQPVFETRKPNYTVFYIVSKLLQTLMILRINIISIIIIFALKNIGLKNDLIVYISIFFLFWVK